MHPYTDAETGFVYLRARYYDPATGQFILRDPLTAMTGALYSYVYGNPLNATDPLGLFCLVHNSHGGCAGAGTGRAIQEPIAVFGTLANHAATIAQIVAATCAIAPQPECVAIAEPAALILGGLGTVASLEVAVYACATSGLSNACKTGAAVTLGSAVSTGVGIRLGPGVTNTALRSILADANAASSTATVRSRLLQNGECR